MKEKIIKEKMEVLRVFYKNRKETFEKLELLEENKERKFYWWGRYKETVACSSLLKDVFPEIFTN